MALIEQSLFDQELLELIARSQELFPRIDTRKGSPFQENVLRPAAIFNALLKQEQRDFAKTQNLKAITENPSEIDDSVVDGIISNFLVERKLGTLATGLLKVRVVESRVYTTTASIVFETSEQLQFSPDADFFISPNPSNSTTLTLFDNGDDTFFFLLPVTALEVGEEYSITQDTPLTAVPPTYLGAALLDVAAFNDFSSGRSKETTEDLVSRTKEAITVRDLVTDKSIKFVIPQEFSYVEAVSPIGFGDREMRRDKQPLIGTSIGGAVDIYARTSLAPVFLVVSATTNSLSQFTLQTPGVDVPFYRIASIALTSNPTKQAFNCSVEHFFDPYSPNRLGQVPLPGKTLEETKAIQARFTVYERATVTIHETGFASKDLQVTLVVPQNIISIQNYVLSLTNRVTAADLLIRGMIPAFVSMEFSVTRGVEERAVDKNAIKQAIFNYVNKILPGTALAVSKIIDIVHNQSIYRVKLPVTVTMELIQPDGVVRTISDTDKLEIESDYTLGISQKTVGYFLSLDDITIHEETV